MDREVRRRLYKLRKYAYKYFYSLSCFDPKEKYFARLHRQQKQKVTV
jgi:hypothetical protein